VAITKSRFQQADTSAFLWCQKQLSHKNCYPLVRLISITGDGWVYALIVFALLLMDYEHYKSLFIASLIGFSLEVPLYMLLKRKFKRNRPQDYLQNFQAKIIPSDQFSFPSGHTAAAFVMATQAILFLPQFAVLAVLWALSVGLSRVALGVHFPGDVLAGMLLGVLCGCVAGVVVL